MENLAVLGQRLVHILRDHLAVRAPDKAEAPFPALVHGDNRHRGGGIALLHPGPVHLVLRQHPAQVGAEAVPAHLADKRGLAAQPGGGYRYVGRRAAWVGGKQGDSRLIFAGLGQINQNFANGCHIHHGMLPSSLI